MQIAIPKAVNFIIETLNHAGYEAFAVGGCVRDALRGVTPHDWDITTSALPQQTKDCFADQRIIEVGIQHGTVALLIDDELYEITTYRIDGDYHDGRHPDQVEFVNSLYLDLARRDFTVNAMAYHPSIGLVDPFGGEADLQAQILCCVGDPTARLTEDALRIMRALRFASTIGFTVESKTAEAIHALKKQLNRIAMERIMTELSKLLCGNFVRSVLTEYADVIFTIIPELAPTSGCVQNTPYHDKDVWSHTVEAVAQIKSDPLLRLTMLLHDVAKPLCYFETIEFPYIDSDDAITIGHFKGHPAKGAVITQQILKRLRCDSKSIKTITTLIHWHDKRPAAEPAPIKKIMSEIGPGNFLLLQQVRKADTMAQRVYYQSATIHQIEQVEALAKKFISEHACISIGELAVTGSDLTAAGIKQGKIIGLILSNLLNAVIEDKLPNQKEQLLTAAKQIYNKQVT